MPNSLNFTINALPKHKVKKDRIPTNMRTLMILEVLGQSDVAMSPTEINRHIDLPKQTIHRLCTTLVEEGFLAREPSSNRLRPTRRLRMMGAGILHASRSHMMRHQVLEQVAKSVKETVNFAVPDDKGMTYIDRIETDLPFRIQLPVGSHVPFHCTASGKTFLASLSPKAQKTMVDSLALGRHTNNTICDPARFLAELHTVKTQGYATDNQEFLDGMIAIAVPVTDDQGRYLASLAFHAPVQRLDVVGAIERKDILIRAAKSLADVMYL